MMTTCSQDLLPNNTADVDDLVVLVGSLMERFLRSEHVTIVGLASSIIHVDVLLLWVVRFCFCQHTLAMRSLVKKNGLVFKSRWRAQNLWEQHVLWDISPGTFQEIRVRLSIMLLGGLWFWSQPVMYLQESTPNLSLYFQ